MEIVDLKTTTAAIIEWISKVPPNAIIFVLLATIIAGGFVHWWFLKTYRTRVEYLEKDINNWRNKVKVFEEKNSDPIIDIRINEKELHIKLNSLIDEHEKLMNDIKSIASRSAELNRKFNAFRNREWNYFRDRKNIFEFDTQEKILESIKRNIMQVS